LSRITENIERVNHNISDAVARYRKCGETVRLMAVTKTVPYEMVNEAVSAGVLLIGETRVQEFLCKKDYYDKSAEIHFIGRLQTNKVKYIAGEVSVVQSVDGMKLANEVNRRSGERGVVTGVLVEVNIGGEETKSGVSPDGLRELIREVDALDHVIVRGLMAIPPPGNAEYCFGKMNDLFCRSKDEFPKMDTLSMGMSDDYVSAIKHGSNLVRLGTALFGDRC
jgi:pyridoxal phosphate enzyme (YggS family)